MNPENLIKTTLSFYDLGTLNSFVRLKHGFANENYKIITEKGKFLLRIHKLFLPEEIKKEHKMLDVLKEKHFPTAYPIADKDGHKLQVVNGMPVSIIHFVEGKIPELIPETVAEVAVTMALLHTMETEKIPFKQNIISFESVTSLLKEFPAATHPMPDIFAQFESQWEQVKPYLSQKLPTGLIHGDVFPDNTLFEGNRLKAIIDFEEFCTDTLLFDMAMCINGFCFTDNRLNPSLLEVFLDAYNQKRPMENIEKELLPHYIQWTALGMAAWHLRYHLMFRADKRQEKRVRELLDRVEYLLSA